MILTEACIACIKQMLEQGKYPSGLKMKMLPLDNTFDQIMLPNVIFWDPLSESESQSLSCPLCYEDGIENSFLTKISDWELAQSNSKVPRLIWDVNWFTALVGRRYSCTNNHSVVSYHSGILKQMPTNIVPFILSHQSGMTLELFDLISRLIDHCNSFRSVELILKESLIDFYHRRMMRLPQNAHVDVNTYFKKLSPSDDFIRKCFLHNYQTNRAQYEKLMREITFEYLSCDPTFKCKTNVGFYENGKWNKIHDSLFLILNEIGQVVAYKFTSGTLFEQVEDLFKELHTRNPHVPAIYVDNCCVWRSKILEIFPNTEVKEDLFNAVQSLTTTLPKRHPFHIEACKELSLVFRQHSDSGDIRKMVTPNSDMIIMNMNIFLNKWRSVEHKGWKLITDNFDTAWRKLKMHIEHDYLSDIPIGHDGTINNEILHKKLRAILPRNRIGIETAHAMFNSLFYYHNSSKEKNNKVVSPIWSFQGKIEINNLEAMDNEETIETLPECMDNTIEFSDDGHNNSTSTIHSLAKKILKLARVFESMDSKLNKEVKCSLFHQEFMTMPVSIWHPDSHLKMCRRLSGNIIDTHEILRSMQLTETKSCGEKKDFITAISMIISDDKEFMEKLGITTPVTEFLTKMTSAEILGQSSNEYESYLSSVDLKVEADKFVKGEENVMEFCNCLLQAVSNILSAIVVIIPSCHSIPFLPVLPRTIALEKVFFVLYNDNVYTGLVPVTLEDVSTKCSCGKSDKITKVRCYNDSRCSCLKRNVACNEQCRCKGCKNGKIEKRLKDKKRRKRIPQRLSHLSPHSTSVIKEEIAFEELNRVQQFVLESILLTYVRSINAMFLSLDTEELSGILSKIYMDFSHQIETNINCQWNLGPINIATIESWLIHRKKTVILMEASNTTLLVGNNS